MWFIGLSICIYLTLKSLIRDGLINLYVCILENFYSKAPKSVTTFNSFTFFRADLIQSEAKDRFQLTSDWIKSARKNVNKLKVVTLLGALLQKMFVTTKRYSIQLKDVCFK